MKTALFALIASTLAANAALELTVKPEREILRIGGSRDCIIQVELTSKPSSKKRATPINVALVLDHSGSMSGAKLEKARQAAMVAVNQLGRDDFLSVVIYDDEAEVLIPPQRVNDKEELKRLIQKIEADGSTALYAGVEKGAAQIRNYFDKEKVNRVILLSDGLANVGPSSTSDLSKLGKELRGEGMSVSTVGLGDDYNEDLMTALAESSHANYYYVQDAEKLPAIFSEELGSVQNRVASKVRLRITLPEGVQPNSVLGDEEFPFKGQTVTIPLEEFFGSQSRRFLISCSAPNLKDERLELAKVELDYADDEGRDVNTTASASVKQTSDEEVSEKSIQSEVASNIAITRNREAKERALRLADAGNSKDAAEILRKQVQSNSALPASAQSSLLAIENRELEGKAKELESNGRLSKSSRKIMQYDNYRDKHQKR